MFRKFQLNPRSFLVFLILVLPATPAVHSAFASGSNTLTVNVIGSGAVSRNPDGVEYSNGSVVTLTATPAADWVFSSWTGDLSGSVNPMNIEVIEGRTVTAHFIEKPLYIITTTVAGSGTISLSPPGQSEVIQPEDVILDCDPGNDQDDIGDLAILHALANDGELRILAIMSSLRQPWSIPNIEIVSRFYGRTNVPMGVPAVNVYPAHDTYGTYLAGNFPNSIKDSTNAQNSIALYRQILAGRQQKSVTLIFAGQMKNLADLWNSPADGSSPLVGSALVKEKVKKIIVVAGIYPNSGPAEYNFATDPWHGAVLNSINEGVTISFMGIEQGNTVEIGGTIVQEKPATHPIREAYRLGAAYGFQNPRPSWTGLALLHAARGYASGGTNLFIETKGYVYVNPGNGTNSFTVAGDANQEYLSKAQPDAYYEVLLDELLMREPGHEAAGGPGKQASPSDTLFWRSNSVVMATAVPAQGWGFKDWNGDAHGSTNPLSVAVDGNKLIIANFVRIGPTIENARWANNAFNFTINNPVGENQVVYGSTDLEFWTPLITNTAPFTFSDLEGTQSSQYRFYSSGLVP